MSIEDRSVADALVSGQMNTRVLYGQNGARTDVQVFPPENTEEGYLAGLPVDLAIFSPSITGDLTAPNVRRNDDGSYRPFCGNIGLRVKGDQPLDTPAEAILAGVDSLEREKRDGIKLAVGSALVSLFTGALAVSNSNFSKGTFKAADLITKTEIVTASGYGAFSILAILATATIKSRLNKFTDFKSFVYKNMTKYK